MIFRSTDVKEQELPWSTYAPCDGCSLQPTCTSDLESILARQEVDDDFGLGVEALSLVLDAGLSSFAVLGVRGVTTWRPKLSEDAVVLFHDTAVEGSGLGVKKFSAQLAARLPSFEYRRDYGLGGAQHRSGGARAAIRRIARASPPDPGGVCFPRCRVDGAISASR